MTKQPSLTILSRIKLAGRLAYFRLRNEFMSGHEEIQVFKFLTALLVAINSVALVVVLNIWAYDLRGNVFLQVGLFSSFLLLSLLMDFLPALRAVNLYQVSFHPIDWKDKFILWAVPDITTAAQYLLLLNVMIICLSPAIDGWTAFALISSVPLARLISLILRFPLTYTSSGTNYVGNYPYAIGSVAVLLIGVAAMVNYSPLALPNVLPLLILLMGLTLMVGVRKIMKLPAGDLLLRPVSVMQIGLSGRKSGRRFSTKLVTSLSVGFVFKLIFLLLNLLQFSKDGTFVFQAEFLFAIFLSPIVSFTYALNNLFAFDPSYFYNIELRTGAWHIFWQQYVRKALVCVSLDAFISFALLWLILDTSSLLIYFPFYISSLILMVGLGLWGSVVYPMRILNGSIMSSYRTYTHPIAALSSMVGVIGVYYLGAMASSETVFLFCVLLTSGLTLYTLRRLRFSRVTLIQKIIK